MVCVCVYVFKAMFALRERPADGEDKRCWRGQSDLWKGAVLRWASAQDPAHSITFGRMKKQRRSVFLFSSPTGLTVPSPAGGWGWPQRSQDRPTLHLWSLGPILLAPHPFSLCQLPAVWSTCPWGRAGPCITSCWVSDLALVADGDRVCLGTICRFPLWSQSTGKSTLP